MKTKKETKATKATKTTKKTKKTNPGMVVNLLDVRCPGDVFYEFAAAKARAGIALSESDIMEIKLRGAIDALEYIDSCLDELCKNATVINNSKLVNDVVGLIKKTVAPKKPWYKRFWNWITRKN